MTENNTKMETTGANGIENLRDFILDYNDLPVKEVKVPEWGNIILYVRAMNAMERDSFMYEKWKNNQDGVDVSTDSIMNNITASTLARVICSDPEGTKRVFSDEDIITLGKKNARALERIQDVFKDVNGDLNTNEDWKKNSKDQKEDSGLKHVDEQE